MSVHMHLRNFNYSVTGQNVDSINHIPEGKKYWRTRPLCKWGRRRRSFPITSPRKIWFGSWPNAQQFFIFSYFFFFWVVRLISWL